MRTDCTSDQLEFQGLGQRRVVGRFDAGLTTSDAGGLVLLREVAERTGWLRGFGGCFRDGRNARQQRRWFGARDAECNQFAAAHGCEVRYAVADRDA